MLKNDRCRIPGIGVGTVTNIRYDTNGVPLYDIVLDANEYGETPTPDGLYVARAEEFSFDSPIPESYAAEVIADSSGKFVGNGIRLATREEAERYARNLMSRWTLVREYRVVLTTDRVNYVADEYGDIKAVS